MFNIKKLQHCFPHPGTVQWIGLRPARDAPMIEPEEATACVGKGLHGDRFNGHKSGKRQITLIQEEHLAAIANLMRCDNINPALIRRNIVVSGINLLALKELRFFVGEAVLEMTGLCHPCSKMETVLGPGGYNAMRGHGGITAKVVQSGIIRLGDNVLPIPS